MNDQEAKLILQGYRPGGDDARDPQFAEALAQAETDAALAEWFTREKEMDAAIATKIRQTVIPADLKATILTGHRVTSPAPWRWHRRHLLALAASLAVLAALLFGWFRIATDEHGLKHFRNEMARVMSSGDYELAVTSSSFQELQQFLNAHQGHADLNLPGGLAGCNSYGCEVMNWNGSKVSLVCFKTESNEIVHLFVINRAALPDAPGEGATQFARAGEWSTASWSRGNKTYVLMSQHDRKTLQHFL